MRKNITLALALPIAVAIGLAGCGQDDSKAAGSRKPRFSALEDGSAGMSDVEARYRGMYEEKMNPFV